MTTAGADGMTQQSELVERDEATPLGRMKIFAAETNDYTIRAAQIRPDIQALIERLSSEDGVTEAMIEAGVHEFMQWPEGQKIDGPEAVRAIYLAMLKARGGL